MNVSIESVRARLGEVYDPCSVAAGAPLSVVDMGMVTDITVNDGHVSVALRPTSPMCTMIACIMEAVNDRVAGLDGVKAVDVRSDCSTMWTEACLTSAGRAKIAARRAQSRKEVPVSPQAWRGRAFTGDRG